MSDAHAIKPPISPDGSRIAIDRDTWEILSLLAHSTLGDVPWKWITDAQILALQAGCPVEPTLDQRKAAWNTTYAVRLGALPT